VTSISIEDLAQFAGASVQILETLADRLPKEVDYLIYRYPTHRGGTREIVAPALTWDTVTKNLHRGFLRELNYQPPEHVHGFVRRRSTRTNAAAHLAKPCVLRVDLKSFFPSISASRVETALTKQGLEPDAASLCRRLVTLNDHLPIGLSTSPFLSNIVFQATDFMLADYCQRHNISFTRYVDDLTFSGSIEDGHLDDIQAILEENNWSVNEKKTAFMRRGGPQYVTGLYVGCSDYPRIPRSIKRQLRWVAHMIETVGYIAYLESFGGYEAGMFPKKLFGWARYVVAVEPDVGYPLLRSFVENIPNRHSVHEQDIGQHRNLPSLDSKL
jgi:RNA-directed DNA polymerase